MTQTVFDNAMVAHVWAQRSQEEGRSHNGNFSFSGDTLYSYSTPIGKFVEVPEKGYAVLVTSRRYSRTTSGKHMPALHRALSSEGYRNEFEVPCVAPHGPSDHAANLAHLVNEFEDRANKALRARDDWRLGRLDDDLVEAAKRVERYAELFRLEAPKLNPIDRASEVRMARAAREAKANTPAAIAKRGIAREQREARAARKLELERLEGVERVEAWKRGEPVNLRYGETGGDVVLRVRGDMLETSLGAKVPLEQAVRVFKFVKLCKARGQGSAPHANIAWKRNGAHLPVGHFEVDWVTTTGSFRAGCHLIHWPEIERVAREIGVLDAEPEDTTIRLAA